MDGNFTLVPEFFKQIYVFRVQLVEHFVTCAYAIMKTRTTNDYQIVLRALLDRGNELGMILAPEYAMLDFEQAPRRALTEIFNNQIEVNGCFFHLAQSTWRKVKNNNF